MGKTLFEEWCEKVEAIANQETAIFNWREVPFPWSDFRLNGHTPEFTAHQLVRAAIEQAEKLSVWTRTAPKPLYIENTANLFR